MKQDGALKLMVDGQMTTLSGMNSGSHPALLKPDEMAFGYNITVRGGFPRTRPKVMRRCLVFQTAEQESWFLNHIANGYGDYIDSRDDQSQIVSVGGRLFQIDIINGFAVRDVTPRLQTASTTDFISPGIGLTANITVADASLIFKDYPIYINSGEYAIMAMAGNVLTVKNTSAVPGVSAPTGSTIDYLDPNVPTATVWGKQAGDYLTIQNGLDLAAVFNGSIFKRRPEIPVGLQMEYSEGRLWVVTPEGEVAAGDQFDPFNPENVISFTEDATIELGGRFQLPFGSGKITGIKVIPNLDTGQGQGPLLVFSEQEIGSINVPSSRAQWKTVTYPITRLVQSGYGSKSQYSIAVVNGDIWNRSIAGIQSFVMAAAAFNDWGNVPQSREVSRILQYDTPRLLENASGILFDNRYLVTYGPIRTPNGVKHRGLVALDFDVISALGRRETPVYDGAWTGFNPTFLMTGIFRGKQRAFALTLNAANQNEFWEITNEYGADNDSVPIKCFVETRSMDWQTQFDMKRLTVFEGWVNDVVGTVNLGVWWKPDFSPQACWYGWAAKTICSTSADCTVTTGCKPSKAFNPGYRSRLSFGEPPVYCEPNDQKPASSLYRAQMRIAWAGELALKAILVKAMQIPEQQFEVDDCQALLLSNDEYVLKVLGQDQIVLGQDQTGLL